MRNLFAYILLQKLGVGVHFTIGSSCLLAATYNALKGHFGRAVFYGLVVIYEGVMVNEHLDELARREAEMICRNCHQVFQPWQKRIDFTPYGGISESFLVHDYCFNFLNAKFLNLTGNAQQAYRRRILKQLSES